MRGESIITGTGSYLPLQFYNGGSSRLSISSAGVLTAADASGLANLNASNLASGTVAGARMPAFSGDATSTAGSTALTLANSGVSAGTYNNVATQVRPFTVDAKGRITSIGTAVTITPAWTDVTGKPTFASTNTNSAVVQRDGAGSFSANTITASTFVGDGGSLTGLNASALSFGTVSNSLLNAASTSAAGIVQLNNTVSSTSTTQAATANAVKTVNDSLTTLINTPAQTFQNIGSGSGTRTITAASGMHVIATAAGNTTWVFPSPSSTQAHALTLELTNGGAYTMTWPTGTLWQAGIAPTLTASGTDRLVFTKAGTNLWIGALSGKDIK
jgi:hypothetical protein